MKKPRGIRHSNTNLDNHMATIESIEIEDLSAFQHQLPIDVQTQRTASTDSSRGGGRPDPEDGDWPAPSSPDRSGRSFNSRRQVEERSVEVDELDVIVMAVQQIQKARSDSSSMHSSSRARHPKSPAGNSTSTFNSSVYPPNKRSPSRSRRRASPVYTGGRMSPPDINRTTQSASARYTMSPRMSANERSPSSSPRASPRVPYQKLVQGLPQAFPDSLSDVPSDVDPGTRERYLKACRLLKAALIERETVLLPTERQFLQGLLEGHDEDDYPPSEDQVSAIETASQTLLSDPLFQVGSVHSSSFGDFGNSASRPAKAAWQERALMKDRDPAKRATPYNTGLTRPDDIEMLPSLVDDEVLTDVGAMSVATVARFDGKDFPFYILGVTPDFKVGVLTPSLMESLRGFFPVNSVSEENFWLKYSLQRDGASLPKLLSQVRTSKYTVLGVETTDGHVFGAFCSAPWRVQSSWFGSGECFLWRLKRSRLEGGDKTSRRNFEYDNEMEVYPYTGNDELIQYCTRKTIAIGGGSWSGRSSSPYRREPTGIGLMLDGDLMGGETNACATFNNPRLGERLTNGNEFDVRNLEVWTMTPSTSIDDAERFEMYRFFR